MLKSIESQRELAGAGDHQPFRCIPAHRHSSGMVWRPEHRLLTKSGNAPMDEHG
jgi:hypothetical protein